MVLDLSDTPSVFYTPVSTKEDSIPPIFEIDSGNIHVTQWRKGSYDLASGIIDGLYINKHGMGLLFRQDGDFVRWSYVRVGDISKYTGNWVSLNEYWQTKQKAKEQRKDNKPVTTGTQLEDEHI